MIFNRLYGLFCLYTQTGYFFFFFFRYLHIKDCRQTKNVLRFILHRPVRNQPVNVTYINGSARGVMVIVVGNGHGDTSSNPG